MPMKTVSVRSLSMTKSQCREAHKKDEANDEGKLNYTKNKNKKRWPTRTMIQMM